MILGFSGCGKSTLARRLGEILGIEPTYMDALNWLPNWVESTREHKTELLASIIERDRWIIDGSYKKILYKERLEKADTIIFLDFNRFLCLYRVIKRRIMYNSQTRPDMGEGCKERIDWQFFKWVIWDGRKKRKRFYRELEQIKTIDQNKHIYIFRRPKKLETFLKEIERNDR